MPEGMEESLASLILTRNKISKIDPRAFDGFKNISKLILERNRLRTIRRLETEYSWKISCFNENFKVYLIF